MKKNQLFVLIASAGLLGGCAATLTPTGEIYTEALLPVDSTTIIVEENYPLIAYGPRYRPAPPPRPRGALRPGPRFPSHGFGRPRHHYGAPGQHRSPGQHRAPGVKGPRSFHQTGTGPTGPQINNRKQGPSGRTGGSQAIRGPQQKGFHPHGSQQSPRGPQQSTRGPNPRGPR